MTLSYHTDFFFAIDFSYAQALKNRKDYVTMITIRCSEQTLF